MEAIEATWNFAPAEEIIQIQKTRKEFQGDYTLVVFPLLKISKKAPEETARILGSRIEEQSDLISGFNVIKGFLNLEVSQSSWRSLLEGPLSHSDYGISQADTSSPRVMIEYSSPNTNKPLHLGHIRNILLGHSMAKILSANGKQVKQVNLVNDRGIHICKSMLAWEKEGNGETPVSSGMKGDHLVGKYYVKYDQAYKKEVKELIDSGVPAKKAEAEALRLKTAWEAHPDHTITKALVAERSIFFVRLRLLCREFDFTFSGMLIDYPHTVY